jgi:acyl-CoA synthetase (AMP-forming)/AMP-acid ligase II
VNLSQILAANAEYYGQDVALVEIKPGGKARREITWGEFDASVNRLANALVAGGVRKDDRVLHLMRNSIDWLVAYFGIIRTGAWAVPLNFRFTASDIKYCADIARAGTMILDHNFTETVAAVRSDLKTVGDYIFAGDEPPDWARPFAGTLADASAAAVEMNLTGDDCCGLYFTSGTTGTPKPILLTHRNLEFAAAVEQQHHYQTADDNFILIPPLYHTGAKMHWFGSLITGSRATLLGEINPAAIFRAVSEEKGTIVWLLVPWVQDILAALDSGELSLADYDLSHWRLMHIGAQPVPPSLVHRWREYFPDMQYDTNYGLSESSGPGCVHLGIPNAHKVGAIGQAGYGWQTRIVDEQRRDVNSGEVGELLVKGDGVMREYYRNPERTAETIRDGWLYTGDIVREDAGGFLYIVDRKKDVIISGGENIYPVEIEETLQAHPQVHDVAVIGLADERLGEIPVAVIAAKKGEIIDEAGIKKYCEAALPRFKVPKRFIFDTVMRNPTGKIEKPKMRQKYGGISESFQL